MNHYVSMLFDKVSESFDKRPRDMGQMYEDVYTAPAQAMPGWDQRPKRNVQRQRAMSVDVWFAIAAAHPRKFRKALAYMDWLDQQYALYSRRT